MSYVALYRTWRPQDFDALVGQEHIRTALTNALELGKIAHAYLFTGPRGTGKTSTARILAKALNCDQGPTAHPCNQCDNCRQITEGASMDVIEIDAASNRGIDEIRQLRERVAFAPVSCRYKVYIIDEVHMITTDAFNALLKTLEEPPEHVVFILATTEPHKIPATIHSRCQRYDFRRVTVDDIAAHLAKVAAGSGIQVDAEALHLMAIQADGGMRDAVSLLDQCGVMAKAVTAETVRQVLGIVGRESLRQLVTLIGQGNLTGALEGLGTLSAQGKDIKQILLEVTEYLRALLLYKTGIKYEDIYLTDTAEAFAQVAPLFTQERILAATKRLHSALEELRFSSRGKIVAELCLFDLCHLTGDTLEALAARVAALEARLASGGKANSVQAAPVSLGVNASGPSKALGEKGQMEHIAVKAAPVTAGASAPEPTFAAPLVDEIPLPEEPVEEFSEATSSEFEPQEQEEKPQNTASPQGEKLWQALCVGLEQRRKKTILAYARLAGVVSCDETSLTMGVASSLAKEKLESKAYSQVMEELLTELVGKSVTLHFVEDKNITPVPVGKASKASAPKKVANAPIIRANVELPPEVKKAQAVFGGSIITD